MKTAVITGATGMIAVALGKYLAENNIKTYCVIRPNSKRLHHIPKHKNICVIECDLTDLHTLHILIGSQCDMFFHFAWEGTERERRNDPITQANNIIYSMEAINTAAKLGCKVYIGAGSQAEYGRVSEKLDADSKVDPENSYGITKYATGKLGAILSNKLGMRYIWVRILSVYGPNDMNDTMIMSCIRSFLNNDPYSFTKSEQMWDYLHCDDAARALYLMAIEGKDGKVYTLGSGIAKPLKEYIYTIRDVINPNLEPGIGKIEYSKNQVTYLCADISNLTEDTGFTPIIDFESGIKSTINWYRNSHAGDAYEIN